MTRYNIDTCSMLVEFNASVWTARKLDKKTTDEVVTSKNAAAKDAARVNKHLLAGRNELDVINTYVGSVRTYVYENTMPWSDSGIRLLPTASFLTFSQRMADSEQTFFSYVEDFIRVYPSLITAQAMALGDMFKRDDYPDVSEIERKFNFRLNFMPVPRAGDFRVDVGNDAQKELQEKLAKLADERVEAAMADVRERLKTHLVRMQDRLGYDNVDGDRRTRKFHDSLVTGALELCDMVKHLNIINDTTLDQARVGLVQALQGVDAKELRTNEAVRDDVRKNVDALLNKFNF
jgi:Protein of unknown function (DUF3150)